ncbi:CcmD family protein [Mucilaginibacter lutimaris]|uniref:CcmD family protein n=1 Tax=Mucilaginibacter lutimaris TaxID=931629 RepID=A0ABW2ZGQ7_9SPHI
MKKLTSLILMLLCFVAVQAQDVEMADKMRSEGKIYVVIGTIVIVFAGLAVYLFTIDRRLKKIEKEN